MNRPGYLMNLGTVPYAEAWELQRALAGAVSQGAIPDTVVLLEHPPVVTLGRRTDPRELHIPEGAEVEIVETNRGGKSTYHGPGQLVCYPIFDLKRHGEDVKLASIGVHVSKWVTTHGYALNVDLDTTPFTRWITACGLEDAAFTTIAAETGRAVSVDEVRPAAAAALAAVFGLELDPLPAEDGAGLWPQPVHSRLGV
jgi:lipoyl(octanoyl) transferase